MTYTPLAGGPQILFLASSQNWIRTLDAVTGTIINQRQVATPFLQSDIGCTDIPGTIGITGTPTIDPTTDIAYFFAKTYMPNYRVSRSKGFQNGVYYFYAVNVNNLLDVEGFPILVDGTVAQNNPKSYFIGGVQLQRPSLLQVGSVVYGAFGGHCDLFNYTGIVMGIDINRKQIVTQFATEAGPLVVQTGDLLENGGGGQGGVWMSGMGLASDGNRLFFVSGNGKAHENQDAPASGSSGCQTLGGAAVCLLIDASTGVLTQTDYFQPFDYRSMDDVDQDFGSGGIVLLDHNTFKGTGVRKMAVTAGKNGKVYVLNADNLGGYKLGPGQTDGVLQTIATNQAVFGAAGSYPGEGGYIYVTPIGFPTYVFKLGFDRSGVPIFTKIARTNEVSAARVGVGIPTVTSLNGQSGTAILWMGDPNAGLRAWHAVPNRGVMTAIPLPQVGGLNKFQRPAFGNGRIYVTDSSGTLYCLGSPVTLPLNCTSPLDFGPVALGSISTMNITCTAIIPITRIESAGTRDPRFVVDSNKLPTGSVAAGTSFNFSVVWDLTTALVESVPNASYGNVSPSVKSTPLTIITTNGLAGYSTMFPISLTGTEVSQIPYLTVFPLTVDYEGIVILDPNSVPSISSHFIISNVGLSNMTVLGYAWIQDELDSNSTWQNITESGSFYNLGPAFTSSELPAVGSILAANTAITIETTFSPSNGSGFYYSCLQIWSTGGSRNIILVGSASTPPIANFSISRSQGGWLSQSNLLMDFGQVAPGISLSLQIRICNQGGSVLIITKSKPPNGIFSIGDPTELYESKQIPVNACAYGTILMNANIEKYTLPYTFLNNTWTLNTNDITSGIQVVQIQGTVVSGGVGPDNSAEQNFYNIPRYSQEGTASGQRIFPNELTSPGNRDCNDHCQDFSYTQQYTLAITDCDANCWCDNVPLPLVSQDTSDLQRQGLPN